MSFVEDVSGSIRVWDWMKVKVPWSLGLEVAGGTKTWLLT